MRLDYKKTYFSAGLLFVLGSLLNSAPYPTDIVLFALGLIAMAAAAFLSRPVTAWHLPILAFSSVAIFSISELLCDPVFLGLRLPPFNRPIESGIHPFAGTIMLWFVVFMVLISYEVASGIYDLVKRLNLRTLRWVIPGIALQCGVLYYAYWVSEGI